MILAERLLFQVTVGRERGTIRIKFPDYRTKRMLVYHHPYRLHCCLIIRCFISGNLVQSRWRGIFCIIVGIAMTRFSQIECPSNLLTIIGESNGNETNIFCFILSRRIWFAFIGTKECNQASCHLFGLPQLQYIRQASVVHSLSECKCPRKA